MLDRTSYIQAVLGEDTAGPRDRPARGRGWCQMSRKRISLRQELPLLVWLVIVWGALWQDFSPGQPALRRPASPSLVARLFYLPPVELSGRFNVLRAVPFALMFLAKVVAASFQVLYLAVARGPKVISAVVAVPLRSHSDLLVTATGHVISLIPGSLVVEVDRSTSTLYIHGINVRNAEDAAKLRKDVRDIEAGLIRIMGTQEELSALNQEAGGMMQTGPDRHRGGAFPGRRQARSSGSPAARRCWTGCWPRTCCWPSWARRCASTWP